MKGLSLGNTNISKDTLSSAQVSLPSLTSPLKSHHGTTFLQYLGKYAFVRRATSSGKFYCKLTRKQPIWNSLETAPGWLNFELGNVFYIIVRYSMKLSSVLQYFFVLGKSIFLHFPSIWNQFIEIVSGRKFWKVPWQTNLNLLNKWPLIFACAYLNTQESSPSGTPLKRLQDVRYSMKLYSFVQYFFVLGKSIFLHFPSIWNQFINIASGPIEM
ncbi:hypothetical protein T06_15451 [Trichinella sp. T6]|nr:hypothetical protein T06_15451 [Trichinella sp. T6]